MGIFDKWFGRDEIAEMADEDVVHREHVLLTSRRRDPNKPAPGFAKVYACTKCKDHFVLGWQSPTGRIRQLHRTVTFDRLPDGRDKDLKSLVVFCPGCRTEYPELGPVLWPVREPPQASQPGPEVVFREHVLLTSRRDMMTGAPGFAETYFCTKCKDGFVLGWQAEAAGLRGEHQVVTVDRLPKRRRDPQRLTVFCPACGSDYSMYGPVLWPVHATGPIRDRERVHLRYPDPARHGSRGLPLFAGRPTERIVMLFTGTCPAEMQTLELAVQALGQLLQEEFVTAFETATLELDICFVNHVTKDPAVLEPFLRDELYHGVDWADRTYVTLGVAAMQAPLDGLLICFVHPPAS